VREGRADDRGHRHRRQDHDDVPRRVAAARGGHRVAARATPTCPLVAAIDDDDVRRVRGRVQQLPLSWLRSFRAEARSG
jgi:hypothetical protein